MSKLLNLEALSLDNITGNVFLFWDENSTRWRSDFERVNIGVIVYGDAILFEPRQCLQRY